MFVARAEILVAFAMLPAMTSPAAAQSARPPMAAPQPSVARADAARPYTLLDPSLTLPPMSVFAPDLATITRRLGDEAPAPSDRPSPDADSAPAVTWELVIDRSQISDFLQTDRLRNDPSTGYSRRLDRDILALGMSWRVSGNQVGLGYQLQAARDGQTGLTRFLPNSEAATHAFTLGVTRPFGGNPPPPERPPLLAYDGAPSGDPTAGATTPEPSPAP